MLDITDNQIGAEGAKAIAQMLEKNEHITDVVSRSRLSRNKCPSNDRCLV